MKPFTQTMIDDQGTIIYLVLYIKDCPISVPLVSMREIVEMLSRKLVSASQTSLYSLKN